MINKSVQEEGITVLNVSASTDKSFKYMKQKPIGFEGETEKSNLKVRNFNCILKKREKVGKKKKTNPKAQSIMC